MYKVWTEGKKMENAEYQVRGYAATLTRALLRTGTVCSCLSWLGDCEMKSNNMDSRGSAVVVALQCQHTSINNLIKSFMANTLFQLPYFFQTGLKALGWILPQPLGSIFVLRLHRFQQRTVATLSHITHLLICVSSSFVSW